MHECFKVPLLQEIKFLQMNFLRCLLVFGVYSFRWWITCWLRWRGPRGWRSTAPRMHCTSTCQAGGYGDIASGSHIELWYRCHLISFCNFNWPHQVINQRSWTSTPQTWNGFLSLWRQRDTSVCWSLEIYFLSPVRQTVTFNLPAVPPTDISSHSHAISSHLTLKLNSGICSTQILVEA